MISVNSWSQEFIYNRGLVTLSIGPALPAYDFGMQQGIVLSSYAKVGTSINAEVSYFTNWNVGYNFMLVYNVNPVNTDKLAQAYMDASPAFQTTSAESAAFRDLAGLGGFIFDVPVVEKMSFTFKMMAGLRSVHKPNSLVKTTTVFSAIDYYETSDNSMIFAFLFGAGGRFMVNELFNIHLNANYMGSTMDFQYYRNKKVIKQKAHIGVLSVLLGVSYAF